METFSSSLIKPFILMALCITRPISGKLKLNITQLLPTMSSPPSPLPPWLHYSSGPSFSRPLVFTYLFFQLRLHCPSLQLLSCLHLQLPHPISLPWHFPNKASVLNNINFHLFSQVSLVLLVKITQLCSLVSLSVHDLQSKPDAQDSMFLAPSLFLNLTQCDPHLQQMTSFLLYRKKKKIEVTR